MENSNLGTFFGEIERLITEYGLLKQHAIRLSKENQQLKKTNQELSQKNKHAHQTVQNIVQRLQEAQG